MDIQSVAAANTPVTRTVADTGSASADVPGVVAASSAAPVQTVNAVQQTAQVPGPEETKDAVKVLNEAMNTTHALRFSMNTDINRTIVEVVDQQTNQVIQQIPNAKVVAIAKELQQALGRLQGLLIKQQA